MTFDIPDPGEVVQRYCYTKMNMIAPGSASVHALSGGRFLVGLHAGDYSNIPDRHPTGDKTVVVRGWHYYLVGPAGLARIVVYRQDAISLMRRAAEQTTHELSRNSPSVTRLVSGRAVPGTARVGVPYWDSETNRTVLFLSLVRPSGPLERRYLENIYFYDPDTDVAYLDPDSLDDDEDGSAPRSVTQVIPLGRARLTTHDDELDDEEEEDDEAGDDADDDATPPPPPRRRRMAVQTRSCPDRGAGGMAGIVSGLAMQDPQLSYLWRFFLPEATVRPNEVAVFQFTDTHSPTSNCRIMTAGEADSVVRACSVSQDGLTACALMGNKKDRTHRVVLIDLGG
jgi:hypothetical protein